MEFDQDDLRVERENGMFLSNNQVKTLKKNNINYKKIQNNMTKKLKNAFNNINKSKKAQKT